MIRDSKIVENVNTPAYWDRKWTEEDRLGECDSVFLEEVNGFDRVMEIGCGTGSLLVALSEVNCWVLGVDISKVGLSKARSRGCCKLVCADVSDLQFAPLSFDSICMQELLEHTDDPTELVTNCWAWLRSGGTLIFSVPHRDESYHEHLWIADHDEIYHWLQETLGNVRVSFRSEGRHIITMIKKV